MADVRCPMCGKSNPEEAENCLFCGERLTGGGIFNPQEDTGSDSADWLSGLRSSNWQADAGVPADADEPAAEENEIPDWLSRVRARSEAETPAGEETNSNEDEPDWLKSLAGDAGQTKGSADDWLAGLGGDEITPAAPAEGSQPSGAVENEWLKDLRDVSPSNLADDTGSKPEEQPSQAEEPAPAQEWMANLADWSAPAAADTSPETPPISETTPSFNLSGLGAEDETPDWFAELTGAKSAEPASPDSTGGENWMPTDRSQPLPEGQPTAGESDLPAWLAGVSAAGIGASAAAQDSAETEELPDWLSRAKPVPAEETASTPAEEIPDWLKNTDIPAAPAAEPSPVEATPDWLSQFSAGTPTVEEPLPPAAEAGAVPSEPAAEFPGSPVEPASEPSRQPEFGAAPSEMPAAEPGSDLPDFSALFGEGTQPVEGQPAPAAENLPDFSAMFADLPGADTPLEAAAPAEPVPGQELPDFSALGDQPAQAAGELPAWLSTAGEPAGGQPAAAGETPADLPGWMKDFGEARDSATPAEPLETSSPFVEEGLPAWLDGMKTPAGEPAEPGVSALIEPAEQELTPELNAPFQVELPDWMNEAKEGDAAEIAAEPVSAELGEPLEKADLPSWVEDLRPLESVIPGEVRSDTGEAIIEKAGPLAGMRGVLQGEDLSAHYRKPPVYSARLRVSDRQRSQAAILENLLGVETASKEVPPEASRAPQLILRVVIALVLVLALLTMLLPNFHLVNVGAAVPAGLLGVYDRIENLPANSVVLLAVDYEPGLSGEMRYSANSVIEHLMVKNARLAIVSTVPTGPVLADGLLAEVRNRRPEYILGDRTVNLGYLPGGTTSLLEFAQDPKRATPYSIDTPLSGVPAWEHAAVSGVNSLQDFALVIVLTDSPETGRAWIEQVQPVLGSVPLTMVTSAQAGPMLQPYYDSAQIQGMVVGLQGGAMYEQKSGRVNLANRFWGAYQTGSLAGLLLLTLGGIISGVMGISSQKSAQKGKA